MYSVKKIDDTAIISLGSSVERGSKEDIDALKSQCRELQNEGVRNIILNMQEVENAPSIVLGTIIVLQKRMKASEGEVAILNPTNRLTRILEITKMDKIIGVFNSEEEALSSVKAEGRARTC
jgi:stage II sporulation protein AA (anti-sigma F factor antagonist)